MNQFTPRLTLALLAATALGACAGPRYPIQMSAAAPSPGPAAPPVVAPGPMAAPAAAREADTAVAPKRSAPVETRALEAPPAAPHARAEPEATVQLATFKPRYSTRLPAEAAVSTDESEAHLILAATHHRTRARAASHDGPAATYTVKKGDTLAEIADRLGVGVSELKAANGLKRSAIHPGQVLKNPKATSTRTARPARGGSERAESSEPETYKVRHGDTLFSIARRFHLTDAELRAMNGLGRKTQIRSGQVLKVTRGDAPLETAGADEPRTSGFDRAAEGRVVEVAGAARSYRVRRGDTASEVADRLDVSVAELARLNHLKKPYRVRRGQVLHGHAAPAKAYVVAPGDTLSEIARRFDVSETALRAANGLKRGARVAPGRKLRLPAGYRDRGAVSAPSRPLFEERPSREPPAALPPGPQPYLPPRIPSRPYTPPPVTPGGSSSGLFGAPAQTPTPSDAQLSQLGRGIFIWPVRGDILSTFGTKAGGVGNDGVNIRAASGSPVIAAAAGDVIYAGDQVPGYGNLVLIRHADGWVTAYGHLSKVDVRMQQKVIQGQQVGQAGQTGGVSEPQVHFEVRYQPNAQERAKPIDPQLVLPK